MFSLQTLFLICFLLFDSLNFARAATSIELLALREQNGFTDCVNGWLEILNKSCTHPGQKTPCFKEPKGTDKTHDQVAREFAENCCSSRCENRDPEPFCCRTRECLNRCYEGVRVHKLRNTQSLEKRSRLSFANKKSTE